MLVNKITLLQVGVIFVIFKGITPILHIKMSSTSSRPRNTWNLCSISKPDFSTVTTNIVHQLVVVLLHHYYYYHCHHFLFVNPIAATSTSSNYDVKKNHTQWIVLLNIWNARYGVNLVLNGHVHAYERSRPVYQDKINKKGIVYVVVGDAASKPGDHDAIYMDPVCKNYKSV